MSTKHRSWLTLSRLVAVGLLAICSVTPGRLATHNWVGLSITGQRAEAMEQPTRPGRRVALVIGNGAYRSAPHLRNPTRDARAMAENLRQLGFDTQLTLDADKGALEQALYSFARRLSGAEVALLYYAGHGIQVGGRNYFIPIDAHLETELDVPYQAIDVQRVVEQLQTDAKAGIILLDACRDNPLANQMTSSSRRLGRGLVRMDATEGEMVIVYATAPEHTAEDGDGAHSPFTTALLRHIGDTDIELNSMVKLVIKDVKEMTGQKQVPWQTSSLSSNIFLGGETSSQHNLPTKPESPASPRELASSVPLSLVPAVPPRPGFVRVPINRPRFLPDAYNKPSLSVLTGRGESELWAGGAYGVVVHYDGEEWSEATVPGGSAISAILPVRPGELWIANSDGLFRGDGKRFVTAAPQPRQSRHIESMWSASPKNIWLVGINIVHFDGSTFKAQELLEISAALKPQRGGGSRTLRAVFGSGAADVWAVGDKGIVIHYDGKRWSQIICPLGVDMDLKSVWSSGPGDVWVGGASYGENLILHYDGQQWSKTRIKELRAVAAISGSGPTDVWALGASIQHYDGKGWSKVDSSNVGSLYQLWVRGLGDVWVVGEDALVLHYRESPTGDPPVTPGRGRNQAEAQRAGPQG